MHLLLLLALLSDAPDDPPYQEAVVVTAEAEEEDAPTATATEGVVTQKEIARRPLKRAGDVLETVPGVIVSQHSGEGKANQYYLRGFNLDHGTDIAIDVAGVPVNMPTHAHGQGYADANFIIPELISSVRYRKGPYFAEEGDFASAGAVDVEYASMLERPIVMAQGGTFGFGRALVAASPRIGDGFLMFAVEATRNDGPWVQPDDYRRTNALLRYSTKTWSVAAMAYDARWSSTDQVPLRAVTNGAIPRFGNVDPTDGGDTSRYVLSADWQRGGTKVAAYAMQYRLDLFSNFTYFLDDPVHGDQFEQEDERIVSGLRATHRWKNHVAGLQVRRDDIARVGLYHTAARERLETISEHEVAQTSVAAFGESTLHFHPRLRAVMGLRADHYRFEVDGLTAASMVSPKLSVVAGPWRRTEVFLSGGSAFHSNDGRGARGGTPLVRTRGGEVGVRTSAARGLHATAALWALDIASELLFVGDAGTTEAGRPTRRTGLELATTYRVNDRLALDAQWAYSRARFRDDDPAGDRVPGAVEGVASAGVSLSGAGRFSGELRYRWFGPRPLIEDDSVRSEAAGLVTARVGYALSPRLRVEIDVFNALAADVSDVDYFYTSRLRSESVPVDDVHFHPVEKRAVRVAIATTF
ncbi:MAG TPA: TonB-dependent receptor [Thermoanaerobaculia bacterium]